MNKIILLGAGHMATQLCQSFHAEGQPIYQVYNRSLANAEHLRKYVSSHLLDSIDQIDPYGNLYIISVSDPAIVTIGTSLFSILKNTNAIIVHTAGNKSLEVLKNNTFNNIGVFYPLQSVRKERVISLKKVPVLITASNERTRKELKYFGHVISDLVQLSSDEERRKLHLPAVIVNNLVNHIYGLAKDYCDRENLPFEYLYALMEETTQRIITGSDPNDVQTGPAVRKDVTTISKHLSQLSEYPDIRGVYELLSNQILKKYQS